MSIKMRVYKRYLRILLAFAISFLLIRSFVIFDYLFDITPSKDWRTVVTRIENPFNLSAMFRLAFNSYTVQSTTCFISLLAFFICFFKLVNVSINRISFTSLKPTINIDNKLEASNPFLYANKTRSLRE